MNRVFVIAFLGLPGTSLWRFSSWEKDHRGKTCDLNPFYLPVKMEKWKFLGGWTWNHGIFAMEIGWAKWTFTKLKGILYLGLGIAELQSSNGPVFKKSQVDSKVSFWTSVCAIVFT